MTAVPAEFVVPLTDGVALDAAAAVTMNGTTAHVLTSLACRIGPGTWWRCRRPRERPEAPWSSSRRRRAPRSSRSPPRPGRGGTAQPAYRRPLPLSRSAEAHALLAGRTVLGKILLQA
jgi:hypothetical protein